jgi:hypothetical protein
VQQSAILLGFYAVSGFSGENGFVGFAGFVQNLHNSAPFCATSQRKTRAGVEQIR